MSTRTSGTDSHSAEETVVAYHERTKHHFTRFAASLGRLDWKTQPDPFRRYEGAPLVRLPVPESGRQLAYGRLYTPESLPAAPLTLQSVSAFFRYALSLTAWKQLGSTTWPLRANPSSGNLHPTEGYALLPPIDGIHDEPALYHYAPKEHGLERRADFAQPAWSALLSALPADSFLIGLASIHWREAWKYGERAFRYCQHDVGHAIGSASFAAAALGWKLLVLDQVTAVGRLLGVERTADYVGAEPEEPELLALVAPASCVFDTGAFSKQVSSSELSRRWYGKANALSPPHGVAWPIIDEAAGATRGVIVKSDESSSPSETLGAAPLAATELPERSAETVILGRRSAVALDGTTAMDAAAFFALLARLVPAPEGPSVPWRSLAWRPRLHLGLFVHRVNGITPGLYVLVRDAGKLEALQHAMKHEFLWTRPAACPAGLPLYLLAEGDCRALATRVSCGQDIAGDGAFSVAMVADYMESLALHGAPFYRNLFWEAGVIGQVLYLEAEAAGVRGTGIGCYFDDAVHAVFGITSREWQSLYHFTVGAPVEDPRLTTLPAYP